jgi:hypothetical protein
MGCVKDKEGREQREESIKRFLFFVVYLQDKKKLLRKYFRSFITDMPYAL